MKAQKRLTATQQWCWPIDLTLYDRSPLLSEAEEIQLGLLLQRFEDKHSHWPEQARKALERLVRPIQDALDITHADKTARSCIVCLLLREMYRRRTSFWAWTQEVWLEILCTDLASFQRSHRGPTQCRQLVIALSYLLCGFSRLHALGQVTQTSLASKIFGRPALDAAVQPVCQELLRLGFGAWKLKQEIPRTLCEIFLANRSPRLEDLSTEVLESVRKEALALYLKTNLATVSHALASLGYLSRPLAKWVKEGERFGNVDTQEGVAPQWASWCQRWRDTSSLVPKSRQKLSLYLLQAGRWLAEVHPDITEPAQWTRDLAAEFVAAVDHWCVGQWTRTHKIPADKVGRPMMARSKAHHLAAMRIFFRDCQEWGWIPRHFDTRRCFATPRAIRALIVPDPRLIADDVWAKLLWAALHLAPDDLPHSVYQGSAETPRSRGSWYPLEMVKAMAIVWLFAGLRSDEWCRLQVGCMHWQRDDQVVAESGELLKKGAVCYLTVPVNKTSSSFVKAVDRVVGEAIEQWELVRPAQAAQPDPKTGEMVQYLFSYRGIRVGKGFLNRSLIPLLCRKAGVPRSDTRGNITSHRARSTIASQLFNAREPMTLFDLKEWLGHLWLSSTQHYAKRSATKVAKAYEKAGYFERNVRTIEVLIDQDAVISGAAAQGVSWKFYDLGHGYCTYDFFDTCPHRMACAKCAFYRPKGSMQAQLLEGKANLQLMLQEIPLTEDERTAVDDGIVAMEKLCQQLANVPTPAGPTPNQIAEGNRKPVAFISAQQVQRKQT